MQQVAKLPLHQNIDNNKSNANCEIKVLYAFLSGYLTDLFHSKLFSIMQAKKKIMNLSGVPAHCPTTSFMWSRVIMQVLSHFSKEIFY